MRVQRHFVPLLQATLVFCVLKRRPKETEEHAGGTPDHEPVNAFTCFGVRNHFFDQPTAAAPSSHAALDVILLQPPPLSPHLPLSRSWYRIPVNRRPRCATSTSTPFKETNDIHCSVANCNSFFSWCCSGVAPVFAAVPNALCPSTHMATQRNKRCILKKVADVGLLDSGRSTAVGMLELSRGVSPALPRST